MKRIGLAIAAAMLGTTGVASAGIAVHQFTLSSSTDSQSVALNAKTENLAANCWVATGSGKAASCSTAASVPGVSVPGVPGGLDQVTGHGHRQFRAETVRQFRGKALHIGVHVRAERQGGAIADAVNHHFGHARIPVRSSRAKSPQPTNDGSA